MDAFLVLSSLFNKETFDDVIKSASPPTNTPPPTKTLTKIIKILYYIGFSLGILLGVYTAHQSWTCYGNLKYNIPVRIIFAIGAFIFGVFYIIIKDAFLYHSSKCSKPRRNKLI